MRALYILKALNFVMLLRSPNSLTMDNLTGP